MERLNETAQDWVPHMCDACGRPMAWEDVLRIVEAAPCPQAPMDAKPPLRF